MTDALTRPKTVIPAAMTRDSEPVQARVARNDAIREYLAFQVATESYALPLAAVREILKPPPITEVPRAPREVLGIISVRGRITTVLDLRRRLGVLESEIDKHSRVLLVDSGDEIMGLLVDRVLQVHRLSEDEVEFAAAVAGEMSEHIQGIGRPRVRGGRDRDEDAAEGRGDGDILILLDPTPLLRR